VVALRQCLVRLQRPHLPDLPTWKHAVTVRL
jgi:hypothetical protein